LDNGPKHHAKSPFANLDIANYPPIPNLSNFASQRFQSTAKADPQLEMALAMSASLAAAQKKAEEDFLNEIGESSAGLSKKEDSVPEVILPEATSWPIGYDKKLVPKSSLIKTTLQVKSSLVCCLCGLKFQTFDVTIYTEINTL